MTGRLFSSSSTHLWTQRSASPNPMQPRQIRDTSTPVFPSLVYSIGFYPSSPGAKRLRAQQRLDRAALVHRPVAFRHLVEGQGQVEDPAGIDLPVPDQVDQLG